MYYLICNLCDRQYGYAICEGFFFFFFHCGNAFGHFLNVVTTDILAPSHFYSHIYQFSYMWRYLPICTYFTTQNPWNSQHEFHFILKPNSPWSYIMYDPPFSQSYCGAWNLPSLAGADLNNFAAFRFVSSILRTISCWRGSKYSFLSQVKDGSQQKAKYMLQGLKELQQRMQTYLCVCPNG